MTKARVAMPQFQQWSFRAIAWEAASDEQREAAEYEDSVDRSVNMMTGAGPEGEWQRKLERGDLTRVEMYAGPPASLRREQPRSKRWYLLIGFLVVVLWLVIRSFR